MENKMCVFMCAAWCRGPPGSVGPGPDEPRL